MPGGRNVFIHIDVEQAFLIRERQLASRTSGEQDMIECPGGTCSQFYSQIYGYSTFMEM
jgi:hypothetical protein